MSPYRKVFYFVRLSVSELQFANTQSGTSILIDRGLRVNGMTTAYTSTWSLANVLVVC